MPKPAKEELLVERHPFSGLVLYEVSGDEMDQIEKETLSISEDFSFGIAGLSVALSFMSTLVTVDITSDRTFYVFFIIMCLGFLVALHCGVRWFRTRQNFKGAIIRIKSRVGPLGQEGKEVQPSELANLPQEEKH